jgi:hypothetical protein
VQVQPKRGQGLEAAASFIGCEGLTNAVKHAGASRIVCSRAAAGTRRRKPDRVLARRSGDLVASVADDGAGGVEPSRGSGLNGSGHRPGREPEDRQPTPEPARC